MKEFDQLEAYIRGTLQGVELEQFQQRLANDPTLQKEVADYRRIFDGLDSLNEDSLFSRAKRWQEKLPTTTKKNRKIIPLWATGAAAAVVAILCVGLWWYLQNQENSLEAKLRNTLASQAIEFTIPSNFRSEGLEETIKDVEDYRINGEYNKAIQLLTQGSPVDSLDFLMKILLSETYVKNNQPQKALSLSRELLNEEKLNRYNFARKQADKIRWTIVLAYLEQYLETPNSFNKMRLTDEVKEFLDIHTDSKSQNKGRDLLQILQASK